MKNVQGDRSALIWLMRVVPSLSNVHYFQPSSIRGELIIGQIVNRLRIGVTPSRHFSSQASFLSAWEIREQNESTMKSVSSKNRKNAKSDGLLRAHSSIVLDGPERAPSRAMLYPVGFKPEDFAKPVIGIASNWSMVTPCNMHLDQLARIAEAGANE